MVFRGGLPARNLSLKRGCTDTLFRPCFRMNRVWCSSDLWHSMVMLHLWGSAEATTLDQLSCPPY
ncbi:hypothetical protein PISMIDRAFT_681398 [Pisolithus microcarpus 441]|uniref:Uncharacterized protein n=1 Tax=Pisolithus microcarpus 441 TaxID=765257 RepID=A0A0C9Z5L5_9AGAM|nr:hypothetical protein PISMIDRAFT_681398 [Pisolithus microcarpus 441]